MTYEIHKEPYQGKSLLADRSRGPKPLFPFRDMAVGDWIRVSIYENRQLTNCVRNVKRSHGIEIQVSHEEGSQHFICQRVS